MVNARIDSTTLDELWLCHSFCASWYKPDSWEDYFAQAQEILGARITHLDETDPVRRRVPSNGLREAAEFVTRFDALECSRWLYGRMPKIRVDFSIQLFRQEEKRVNSVQWYFRPDFIRQPAQLSAVGRLFEIGNKQLRAFYSYSDSNRFQMAKTKPTGAVNIFDELLGVFWLTYFDHHYVDFFGGAKLAALERIGIEVRIDEGATLRLGEGPESVPVGLRQAAEEFLGPKTFVNPKDLIGKWPGQYALTYDQLQA